MPLAKQDVQCSRDTVNLESKVRSAASRVQCETPKMTAISESASTPICGKIQPPATWADSSQESEAHDVWRAQLEFAKEREQFNCECDAMDMRTSSPGSELDTHLNAVRTRVVTVARSRRKLKLKDVSSAQGSQLFVRMNTIQDETHVSLGVLSTSVRKKVNWNPSMTSAFLLYQYSRREELRQRKRG